jgi:hypothetical protein
VAAKMPGEFEERDIFLPDRVLNSDSAEWSAREPHDGPPGAAELALEGFYFLRWKMEMLFK